MDDCAPYQSGIHRALGEESEMINDNSFLKTLKATTAMRSNDGVDPRSLLNSTHDKFQH